MQTKEKKEYTTEELKAMLADQEEKERKERLKKERQYQADKDEMLADLCHTARSLNLSLESFKKRSFNTLNEFYDRLMEFGDVASDNKGNITLTDGKQEYRVEFTANTTWGFDERSAVAEKLIKEFLADTVKKRDLETYELIVSLLDKTRNEELDPRAVQKLYKFEEAWADERWRKAIKLLKNSYQEKETRRYVKFKQKTEDGEWKVIQLQFSAISVDEESKEKS